MIVVFPFSFPQQDARHTQTAEWFVSKTKGVDLVQLSDHETPPVCDAVYSIKRSGGLGRWYFEAMAGFPANEFLRLDTDVLMRSVPYEVFDQPFDLAIASENKGTMNNGVFFARNKQFFRDCLDAYEARTTRNDWNDIQVAIQTVINEGPYRVLRLDPKIYNFMPQKKGEYGNAKLVHFEGPQRKAWLE